MLKHYSPVNEPKIYRGSSVRQLLELHRVRMSPFRTKIRVTVASEYRTVRAPCWPGAGSSIERSVTSNNCWKELATGAASVFPAIPRYWLPASRSTDCCCTPRSVLKPRVPSLAIIPRSVMCGRYRRTTNPHAQGCTRDSHKFRDSKDALIRVFNEPSTSS